MEDLSARDGTIYRIHEFPVGKRRGAIGVSGVPGRCDGPDLSDFWLRDLRADLTYGRVWGARYLVNLLEPDEEQAFGVTELPQVASQLRFVYCPLPMQKGRYPRSSALRPWGILCRALAYELMQGHQVLIVSADGTDRACTIACTLLLSGWAARNANQAIAYINRQIPEYRPGPLTMAFLEAWSDQAEEEREDGSSERLRNDYADHFRFAE